MHGRSERDLPRPKSGRCVPANPLWRSATAPPDPTALIASLKRGKAERSALGPAMIDKQAAADVRGQ